jgi:hypothetical protein
MMFPIWQPGGEQLSTLLIFTNCITLIVSTILLIMLKFHAFYVLFDISIVIYIIIVAIGCFNIYASMQYNKYKSMTFMRNI